MTDANLTTTLTDKLDEVLVDIVVEKAKNFDYDPMIEEAVINYNIGQSISKEVEEAVENFDFDSAIEEAVRDFDFDRAIDKHVDFDQEVDKAIDDADIDGLAETAVERELERQLPAAIESALFKLLERPEVAERLVKLLFDRAAE